MATERSRFEQQALAVDSNIPSLNRFERLRELKRDVGFYPHTKREQAEAMSLQSFPASKGGAARHIAEISTRQHTKTNMRDPRRTALRVVRDYIGYAVDAHASQSSLTALLDRLRDIDNPELHLSVADIQPADEGVLPYLRYTDLAKLAETERIDRIGYDPQRVTYTSDNGGIRAFAEIAIDGWRIHQVRTEIPGAIHSEQVREHFWTDRLGEVADHSYRALARVATEGLDLVSAPAEVK